MYINPPAHRGIELEFQALLFLKSSRRPSFSCPFPSLFHTPLSSTGQQFTLSSRRERLRPAPHNHLFDLMRFEVGSESSWVDFAISVHQKYQDPCLLIWYQSTVTRRMRRSSHTWLTYQTSTQIDLSSPRQLRRGQRGKPTKYST
jgi:hypothetical protein